MAKGAEAPAGAAAWRAGAYRRFRMRSIMSEAAWRVLAAVVPADEGNLEGGFFSGPLFFGSAWPAIIDDSLGAGGV